VTFFARIVAFRAFWSVKNVGGNTVGADLLSYALEMALKMIQKNCRKVRYHKKQLYVSKMDMTVSETAATL